jgi:hypothetical protein
MHILLVSKNNAEKYISPFDGDVCLQMNASRQTMNNIFEVLFKEITVLRIVCHVFAL